MGEPGSGKGPTLIVLAHAGADDVASILSVAAVVLLVVVVQRARRHRKWWPLLALTVILGVSAVATSRVTPSLPPQARVRPASTARLTVVEPRDGDVTGRSVTIRLRLDGGHLVAATSTHLAPDQGHVHVLIDGRVVSSTSSLTAHVRVAPGRHVLQAEYVALDHGPFHPRVLSVVIFTAR